MMKTIFKKYAALIGALCAVMLVISGCAFDDFQTAKGEPGTGTVKISINGANARTIYPDVTFGHYVVTVVDESDVQYGQKRELTVGAAQIILPITTAYTINVEAYVNAADETAGKIAATGSVAISATDLQTQHATVSKNIVLTPVLDDGEGTFSWHLTTDGTISAVEITVDGETIDALSDTSVTLDAGVYIVVFKITYKDGQEVSFVEDLYVFANMTSTYTEIFREFHFYEMIDYVLGILHKSESWEDRLAELETEYFYDLGLKFGMFENTIAEFEHIIGSNSSLLPANLAELKALVDVSIIQDLIKSMGSDLFESATAIESAIDELELNGTSIVYGTPVHGAAHDTVEITVGKYNVFANIVKSITSFDITVAGATQTVQIAEMKGNNTTRTGIEHGFQQSQSAGYEYAWSGFSIDLGARKLSDFGTVKATIEGVSGDVAWKTFELFAGTNITNYSTLDAANDSAKVVSAASTQTAGATPAVPYAGAQLTAGILQNAEAKELTGKIDVVLLIKAADKGVAGGADSPTVFKFTNIIFELGEECEYCEAFPCECPTSFDITIGDETATISSLTKTGNAVFKMIDKGFEVSNSNNNWGSVQIPIDLGDKKLDEVATIAVVLTSKAPNEGDNRPHFYKDFLLLAHETAIPSGPWTDASEIATKVSTGGGSINTAIPLTFTIDQNKVDWLDLENASTFVISFVANMGSTARYTLTDIVITFKD